MPHSVLNEEHVSDVTAAVFLSVTCSVSDGVVKGTLCVYVFAYARIGEIVTVSTYVSCRADGVNGFCWFSVPRDIISLRRHHWT